MKPELSHSEETQSLSSNLPADPSGFLDCSESYNSAKERRSVSRLVLNFLQPVYSRLIQGAGGRAQDRTEAYGLGILETRAFLRALQSWEGQRLGKDAGGAGEGKDLWHFPSSWKQRQIPVSCMSNPVPPSQVTEPKEIPLASGLTQSLGSSFKQSLS